MRLSRHHRRLVRVGTRATTSNHTRTPSQSREHGSRPPAGSEVRVSLSGACTHGWNRRETAAKSRRPLPMLTSAQVADDDHGDRRRRSRNLRSVASRLRRGTLTVAFTVTLIGVCLVALCAGPAVAAPAGAAAPAQARPADTSPLCLVGYCITSVAPMGDGAIECSGQLTEVLQINVSVGVNIGYAFPYVTANVTDGDLFASGFASDDESGTGPAGLMFIMRIALPGPGTYTGTASGEGAGLPPSLAPDFPLSFSVPEQSPISVAEGDATCQGPDPSLGDRIETAIYGAVLMGPYGSFLAEGLGETAAALHAALELYDSYEGFDGLLEDLSALDDPPDPNYASLVQDNPPPPASPPSGLTPTQAATSSAAFANYASLVGDLRAFVTSYERAWGAEDAGSVRWYDQQLAAAAGFATDAADQLEKLPTNLTAAQQAFAPQPLNVYLTPDDLANYQNAVMAGGDDATQVADLQSLGLTESDADSVIAGSAAADASQYVGIDLSTIFTAADTTYQADADRLNAFAAFANGVLTAAGYLGGGNGGTNQLGTSPIGGARPKSPVSCSGLENSKLKDCQARRAHVRGLAACGRKYDGKSKAVRRHLTTCRRAVTSRYHRVLALIKCSQLKNKNKRVRCVRAAAKANKH
jgi:hypothetical protein